MAKYFDVEVNELVNPELSNGTVIPRKTEYHEGVPAVTHTETKTLPGGKVLSWEVIDTPAMKPWRYITEYTFIPDPVSVEERVDDLEAAVAELGTLVTDIETAVAETDDAVIELGNLIAGGV